MNNDVGDCKSPTNLEWTRKETFAVNVMT